LRFPRPLAAPVGWWHGRPRAFAGLLGDQPSGPGAPVGYDGLPRLSQEAALLRSA
jgi:hypothetical protein